MEYDVTIRYCNLPCTVRAYTVSNADNTYTVIMNARMSRDVQLQAYLHELSHIKHGDFEKKCSAGMLELFAHREK